MKPKNSHKGSLQRSYIVVDLETGGLDEERNPIVEIAVEVVKFNKKTRKYEIISEFSFDSLVKPYDSKLKCEARAMEINNIKMKDILKKGNKAKSVLKLLLELVEALNPGNDIKNKPALVGHNIADFDYRFLNAFFEHFNLHIEDYFSKALHDTLHYSEILMATQTNIGDRRLSTVTSYFGITNTNAHRASTDAHVTALLFCKFCNILSLERTRRELLSL